MSWNGAGVYSRGYASWTNDAANNLPISATKFDTEDNDFAGGINNCLCKDGQNSPTAALTWTIASAAPLSLLRQTNGTVFAAGRSTGSNNPNVQIVVTDGTGAQINLTTAQTLSLAIMGTNALSVGASGTVTIAGASSGNSLVVATTTAQNALFVYGPTTAGQSNGMYIQAGTNAADNAMVISSAANTGLFSVRGDGQVFVQAGAFNAALGATISGTLGVVSPVSGNAFQIANNANNLTYFSVSSAGGASSYSASSPALTGTSSFNGSAILANNADQATQTITTAGPSSVEATSVGSSVYSGGSVVFSANNANWRFGALKGLVGNGSGNSTGDINLSLRVNTSDTALTEVMHWYSTGGVTVGAASGGSQGAGTLNVANGLYVAGAPVYAGIPATSMGAANYTTVSTDNGKQINAPYGGYTATIASGYPVGAAITFTINAGVGTLSIASSDPMVACPSGATGTRTLTGPGSATAIKTPSGTWLISGSNLT